MVEINYKIMICGIISLTIIYIVSILAGNYDSNMGIIIVGIIGVAIGVILPSPRVDNKRGVLTW